MPINIYHYTSTSRGRGGIADVDKIRRKDFMINKIWVQGTNLGSRSDLKGTVVNRKITIRKPIYSINIVSYAKFSEECIDDPNTVSKCEPVVCHNSFDLMELRQVGRVQGLVSEHAICSQYHQILNKYCTEVRNTRSVHNTIK